MKNAGANSPHNDTESKKEDGKDGIVNGGLLRSLVTSFPVSVEDEQREGEGYAGDDQKSDLWPRICALGPWREIITWRDCLGRIEDREGSRDHR